MATPVHYRGTLANNLLWQAVGQKLKAYLAFKNVFIGITLLCAAFLITLSFLTYKPKYVSTAVVMVKNSAITSRYITADNYPTASSEATNPVLNTMGLLKSNITTKPMWEFMSQRHPDDLAKKKIKSDTQWKKFYKEGKSFLKYKNMPGTDIITLEFSWDDPVIAQEGLAHVINVFKTQSLALNQSEHHERSRYLAGKVQEMEQKLIYVSQEISRIKKQSGITDIDKANENMERIRLDVMTEYASLNSLANSKHAESSQYRKLLNLNPAQALTASALGSNPTMAKLREELYAVQNEISTFKTRYRDENPKMVELVEKERQLIASISQEIGKTIPGKKTLKDLPYIADQPRSEAINKMVQAEAESKNLRARASTMSNYLSTLESRMSRLPEYESKLVALKAEEDTLKESLRALRQQELDTKVKELQTLSNVFDVQTPDMPEKPSFPTLLHLMAIDICISIGFGLAAIFWLEKFQSGKQQQLEVRYEQVERNSQPVSQSVSQKMGNSQQVTSYLYSPEEQLMEPAQRQADTKQTEAISQELEQSPAYKQPSYIRSISRQDDVQASQGTVSNDSLVFYVIDDQSEEDDELLQKSNDYMDSYDWREHIDFDSDVEQADSEELAYAYFTEPDASDETFYDSGEDDSCNINPNKETLTGILEVMGAHGRDRDLQEPTPHVEQPLSFANQQVLKEALVKALATYHGSDRQTLTSVSALNTSGYREELPLLETSSRRKLPDILTGYLVKQKAPQPASKKSVRPGLPSLNTSSAHSWGLASGMIVPQKSFR